jgi:hypothetical protein
MTTARKAEANRINARRSTGPRTRLGKARASRSARRHGLSIPVLADGGLSKEVEVLARKMVGSCTSANVLACARRVAEAQVDLERARRAAINYLRAGWIRMTRPRASPSSRRSSPACSATNAARYHAASPR